VNVAFVFDPTLSAEPTETLAQARMLAEPGEGVLWAAACLSSNGSDPRQHAGGLGVPRAAFLVDPALAGVGPRGQGQALAALLHSLSVDLVLMDDASDSGGGVFLAALAHHLGARGLQRAFEVAPDPSAGDHLIVGLRLGGQRRRLRVRLPAVISLAAPARALHNAAGGAAPELRVVNLASLGLSGPALTPEPAAPVSSPAARLKPRLVTDIGPLLRDGEDREGNS
jgi:electron transfer flavoprotein alpha/beta subunit